MKLPKRVYVYWYEEKGEDPWLGVVEDIDGLNDGQVVGVYELKEIKNVEVITNLK